MRINNKYFYVRVLLGYLLKRSKYYVHSVFYVPRKFFIKLFIIVNGKENNPGL